MNFVMLVGLPGSGKSTRAERYREWGYVIHSSDAIREELFGDAGEQTNAKMVFDVLHERVMNDLKSGKNVVYDATNVERYRRVEFLQKVAGLNVKGLRKVCEYIDTPIDKCKERNRNRDRVVPEDVIDRMNEIMEYPNKSEGWDAIYWLMSRRS